MMFGGKGYEILFELDVCNISMMFAKEYNLV